MTLNVLNCFGALRRTCPRWSISKTANIYFKARDKGHGWCVVVRVLLYIRCDSPTHFDVCALFFVFGRNAHIYLVPRVANNYGSIRQAHMTVAL